MVSCQAPCNGNAQDPKILVEKSPDFVLRQIFLFPSRGTSCQLTLCVCGFFPAENPRQFTVLAYSCPFLAGDTGAQKKLLSFHLINTRTGENVTGSHRRKTPCGEAVERRLLDARNLFPAGAAEVALLQLFRAAAAPDFLRIGKASWSQWWQRGLHHQF